jgi:hypothetical protein
MHKAHARVELWIACQPSFHPRHADEHHANTASVEDILHPIEGRHLQAVCLVDDD